MDWLLELIRNMLQFLGLLSSSSSSSLTTEQPPPLEIFIRTKDGKAPIPLQVKEEESTIQDLKEEFLLKVHESTGGGNNHIQNKDIKIIFQGKVLKDDVRISDCHLGSQSILDAVIIQIIENKDSSTIVAEKEGEKEEEEEEEEEDPTPSSSSESSISRSRNKSHFYIYCSLCGTYNSGKLRVKCKNCQRGAIVVHRDPCNWDDVLEPGKITGACETCSDSNATVQFYFKCSSTQHENNDDPRPPLYLIRSNMKSIPCLACTDTKEPVFVFECEDQHVICTDCFNDYCTSKLNERQFILDSVVGYTLSCPVLCEQSLIKETKHFHLMGKEQYDRYQRFAAEECVLQSGGILCPQPGCGAGIIPDENCRRITCQAPPHGCGYVFCRQCLQGFHIGDCPQELASSSTLIDDGSLARLDPNRVNSARWNETQDSSSITIRIISKPCPKCRTPTERAGGCMHMSCSKPGCGFQWCWVCQTEWTRDCMASHWFG